MATTINRADIGTNDTGTGTNGTVIDTTYVALAIYDKIDAILAGNVALGGTLDVAGGQIKFPATQAPSTNVNTLDDYEEGTWTPAIGGSGGTTGQTYTAQVGRYVKIGRMVWAACYVVLSNKGTITGDVELQGLPFTSENVANQFTPAVMGYWNALAVGQVFLGGYISPNSATVRVNGATAAAVSTAPLAAADISHTTALMVSVVYSAAS